MINKLAFEFDVKQDTMLTRADLCQLLDVSTSTFNRWVTDGKFPAPCCHLGGSSKMPRWADRQITEALMKKTNLKEWFLKRPANFRDLPEDEAKIEMIRLLAEMTSLIKPKNPNAARLN